MAKIDWDYWRHKYVTGDDTVTYRSLADVQGAPAYQTLRNRASQEDWPAQRKRFKDNLSTVVATVPEAQHVAQQVSKLVDTAEMLTRHIKAARLAGQKAIQSMQSTDPTTLKPQEALAWLKFAVEAERLAEGLATERQEIDLSTLSDEELDRLING
jgi:flagellar hook-basal body complex protein FliE